MPIREKKESGTTKGWFTQKYDGRKEYTLDDTRRMYDSRPKNISPGTLGDE